MVVDVNYWGKVVRRIVIFILSIFAFFILLKFSFFYLPFVIALAISLLIDPLIKIVNRKTNLERKTSAILVIIVLSIIILMLLGYAIISLIGEANSLLNGLNEYTDNIYNLVINIFNNLQSNNIELPNKLTEIITGSAQDFLGSLSKWVSNVLTNIVKGVGKVPTIGVYAAITLLATYFISVDKLYLEDQIEHHFPRKWAKKFFSKMKKICISLGEYLKAQALLILIDFIQIIVGLFLLKIFGLNINYPFIAGVGIAFVDALPILGTGTVMIPWAVFSAINGDIKLSIGLLAIYIVQTIVRQFLEPKIVSSHIGIHPIFTLIAMYTGFKVMGVWGLLLGPITLIILKNIYGTMIDKGIIKTIFDKN